MSGFVASSPDSTGSSDQCRELHLLGDLNYLLMEAANTNSRNGLITIVNRLLADHHQRYELESATGYLLQVLEQSPELAVDVHLLRNECIESISRLEALKERILQESSEEIDEALHGDLCRWLRKLARHRVIVAELVQKTTPIAKSDA